MENKHLSPSPIFLWLISLMTSNSIACLLISVIKKKTVFKTFWIFHYYSNNVYWVKLTAAIHQITEIKIDCSKTESNWVKNRC